MQEHEDAKELDQTPDEEGEEGTTEEVAAPETKQPTNELKVVIVIKADKCMVGVQSPDCDPVYRTMTGDLAAALEIVPGFVAEAKQKWEANPRYPKADLPEPPPPTSSQPARQSEPKQKVQPSFF